MTSVIDLTVLIEEEDGREFVVVGGRRFYAGPPVDTRTKKRRAPPVITPLRVDEPPAPTATPSQGKPDWVPDSEWAEFHAKYAAEMRALMARHRPSVPAGAASSEQVQPPDVVEPRRLHTARQVEVPLKGTRPHHMCPLGHRPA